MILRSKILRSIFFLLILIVVPFIYEYIGINYGAPLGARYFYLKEFKPQIFGLPVVVWFFWIIFIFIAYSLTNSFLIYFFNEKYDKILRKNLNIIFLSLIDGFVVLIFDIFLDPVAVKFGLWRWENFDFSYFGVPIGNFVGWYIIATTTTLFLRSIDIILPTEINKFWLNMVQYIYLFLILILFIISLSLLNLDSALMGLIISAPINLFAFKRIFEKILHHIFKII